MLAKAVRKNLKDINTLRMRTRATKFSSMFSSDPTVENNHEIRQHLKRNSNLKPEDISYPEDFSEYIVEDPNEQIVDFQIFKKSDDTKEHLPFFKSIKLKLGTI